MVLYMFFNQWSYDMTLSNLWDWTCWIFGSLLWSVCVFAMAGTGVMFIMNGDWITVWMGYGCVTIAVLTTALAFLIIHTSLTK